MTVGGWIFLAVAWTSIIVVLFFCYRLLLKKNTLGSEAQDQAQKHGPFGM